VQNLEQTLSVGRQQVQNADAAAAQYFSRWDQELKSLSDDLGRSSKVRGEQTMASFDKLRADIRAFGQQVRPYLSEMDESMRYLRTAKTVAGVKTVTPEIREALGRQPLMLSQLDSIRGQIDAIRGSVR
jgi:hypothetical protein